MRGSATASIIFARRLGNTLGATALGAVLNIGIRQYSSGELATRLHDLLNEPTGLGGLASNPDVRMVFYQALYWSFWGVVVVAILTVSRAWLIPVAGKGGSTPADDAADEVSHDLRAVVGASEIDQPCMAPIQPAMARPISSGESS
jgi:hypothetical protein